MQGIAARERSSRKTKSFEEQTMSKDKYRSVLSGKMEAILLVSGSALK